MKILSPFTSKQELAEQLSAEQSTKAYSRKLLGQLIRRARLYCTKRHNNSPTGIIRYVQVKDAEGNKVQVAVRHHRARTKPERRHIRRHQRKLQLNTMRSYGCALQGKSSSPKWAG
jgi:hypothetical protein